MKLLTHCHEMAPTYQWPETGEKNLHVITMLIIAFLILVQYLKCSSNNNGNTCLVKRFTFPEKIYFPGFHVGGDNHYILISISFM